MSELIDREATVKQICKIGEMVGGHDRDVVISIALFVQDDKTAFPTVERPHGEWIPCSERLPNAECGESNSVLCQLENDTMKVLYWNGGNWRNPTGELYHSVNHKNGWHNRVIAWMPLPKPYQKEGEEDDADPDNR